MHSPARTVPMPGAALAALLCVALLASGAPPAADGEPMVLLLDAYGRLFRGRPGGQPLQAIGQRLLQEPLARDVEAVEGGIYILTGRGEIHRGGFARPLPEMAFGLDLARDLAYLPADDTFYLLDGHGMLFALGESARLVPRPVLFPSADWARKLAVSGDGTQLFLLDVFGNIDTLVGGELRWRLGLEQPSAVDVEIDPRGIPTILLADGRVIALLMPDGAPAIDAPYFGAPLARDLEWFPGGGGYVLDVFGGIHAFGGAAAIAAPPAARGLSALWGAAVDLELVDEAALAPPARAALGPSARVAGAAPTVPYWRERIDVEVDLESGADVAGFVAELGYDPNLLSPVLDSARPGAFLTALGQSARILPPTEVEPGRLSVRGVTGAAAAGAGSSGDGALFHLAFSLKPRSIAQARANATTTIRLLSLVCNDPLLAPQPVPATRCEGLSLTLLYLPPRVGLSFSDTLHAPVSRLTVRIGDTFSAYLVASDVALARGAAFDLRWTRPNLEEARIVEGPLFSAAGPTATLFVTSALANRVGARRDHAVSVLGRRDGARGHGVIARLDMIARRTGRAVIELDNVCLADDAAQAQTVRPDPQRLLIDVAGP